MEMKQPSLLARPIIKKTYDPQANIILHCGDSFEFFRSLPSNLATLIITSPPYNIGKIYETRKSIEEYLSEQEIIINELVRILAEDGSICWEVGNHVDDGEIYPLDIYFYRIFKDKGLHLRNRIIWHFGHGLHASKRFSGRYETILWFTKEDKYKFNLDRVRVPGKYPGKRHYKGPNIGKPSGILLEKIPRIFGR